MASVFLSYDREDAIKAQRIALVLESGGHSVWWDRHIKGGAQYSKEIEEALDRAEAVVVLWSEHSIDSAWVRDEAAAGRDSGRLVPVRLDGASPPLGFRQYQTIDLSAKSGRGGPKQFRTLLDAVDALGGASVPEAPAVARPRARPAFLRTGLIGLGVAFIVVAALLYWKPWSSKSTVPVVAIAAAEPTASSRNLARELLVRLGSLQSQRSDRLNLVEEGQGKSVPDLIFQIGKSDADKQATANLVLLDGTDRGLLWSKEFRQPSNDEADLRQQVTYTAARVLDCALDGLAFKGRQIPQQTLKLYLNGCAQIAELAGADPRPVIPIFQAVIKDAPRFEPAWANLMLAEADVVDFANHGQTNERDRQQLREHIRDARKLNPAMAEATLAEISLLPAAAFKQSLELIERAKDASPDNSVVLSNRASLLQRVGRMREGVEDAERATELDPLSPFTRSSYISALAYAGRTDSARDELRQAEQLWPGTKSLQNVQFRFNLRYGDPREALRIAKARGEEGRNELYLSARIDPSAANVERLMAYLRSRRAPTDNAGLATQIQAYGEFGRTEDVVSELSAWPNPEVLAEVAHVFFRPALRTLRNDPRFLRIAQRAGLLDYWRSTGKWPDYCADPDLPYDCKKEAAKLSH